MSDNSTQVAEDKALMHSIIQRVATGPELSKDISQEEARAGMRAVLDGHIDPVQAGIFLIGLRMKRETTEENRGILDGIIDFTGTGLNIEVPAGGISIIGTTFDVSNLY